jgi:predicted component of type VI protein secretion system
MPGRGRPFANGQSATLPASPRVSGERLLREVVDSGIRRSSSAGEALEVKVIAQVQRRMGEVLADDDPTEAEAQMRDAERLGATADAILTLDRQPAVGTKRESAARVRMALVIPLVSATSRISPAISPRRISRTGFACNAAP